MAVSIVTRQCVCSLTCDDDPGSDSDSCSTRDGLVARCSVCGVRAIAKPTLRCRLRATRLRFIQAVDPVRRWGDDNLGTDIGKEKSRGASSPPGDGHCNGLKQLGTSKNPSAGAAGGSR